jgi:3-keto-L-gulonate-6-phosphate decarboxylase
MSKTFIISLLDFAMGGELLEIKFTYITPEQIKNILEALQELIHNIIHQHRSFDDMVHDTVQRINASMAAYENNTVICSICSGLTEEDIYRMIRLLDEETMSAEIGTTIILEHGAVISKPLRQYIHHVHHRHILAVELGAAQRFNWTNVLHELQIPETEIKQS